MLSDINEVTALVGGRQGTSEVAVPMTSSQLGLPPALGPGVFLRARTVFTKSSDASSNTKPCSAGCDTLHPGEAVWGRFCVPSYWKVKFKLRGIFFYLPGPGWSLGGWLGAVGTPKPRVWHRKSTFSSLTWIPGKQEEKTGWHIAFFLCKGPYLITFYSDSINGTLQQLLLKYLSALGSIRYFHVVLVQEFPVTQEKLQRIR